MQETLRLLAMAMYVRVILNLMSDFRGIHNFIGWFSLVIACAFFSATVKIRFKCHLDASKTVIAFTLISLIFPFFMSDSNVKLIDISIGISFLFVGLSLSFASLIGLGDSFDILPNFRKVKSRGSYGWVRHPMYTGYIITLIGHLFLSFSFWNVTLTFVIFYSFYKRAISEEERLVCTDFEYENYRKRVKYMFFPSLL